MPFHAVPQTVEVKIKGDHEGDPRITTLHYRYGPAGGTRPSQAELVDLTAAIVVNVINPLSALVSNITRWTSVSAQDIADATGLYYERTLNPVLTGNQLAEALPGNVNLFLQKVSTDARRRGKGGTFVMDLTENLQSNAAITASAQTLALTLASGLLRNEGVIRNFVAVVASKKFGTFAPLVTVAFDLITDSLRTRLKNHRRHRRTP